MKRTFFSINTKTYLSYFVGSVQSLKKNYFRMIGISANPKSRLVFLFLFIFINAGQLLYSQTVNTLENTVWKGYYNCTQGQTGLQLSFVNINNELKAYFEFKGTKTGKYILNCNLNEKGKSIVLIPWIWVNQPYGYVMVGLSGVLENDGTVFKGKIDSQGCSDFYLVKQKTILTNDQKQISTKAQSNENNRIQEENIITGITLSDIDGNVYKTKRIGTQTWMVENLKTTRYRNGEKIRTTKSITNQTEPNPKYQWPCNGNENLVAKYGRLYTWYAVIDPRNIAPEGWHVPTKAEWKTLIDYLKDNGYNYDGSTLFDMVSKSLAATTDWKTSIKEGAPGNDLMKNNKSGFSGLPSGYFDYSSFESFGETAYWWSATRGYYEDQAELYYIHYDKSAISPYVMNSRLGFSVRCVKDEEESVMLERQRQEDSLKLERKKQEELAVALKKAEKEKAEELQRQEEQKRLFASMENLTTKRTMTAIEYDGAYIESNGKYYYLKPSAVSYARFGWCIGSYDEIELLRTYFLKDLSNCISIKLINQKIFLSGSQYVSALKDFRFCELVEFKSVYRMCVTDPNTGEYYKTAWTPRFTDKTLGYFKTYEFKTKTINSNKAEILITNNLKKETYYVLFNNKEKFYFIFYAK